MAEKEIKTLLSRTLLGQSDVFKEYLNDRLWDSILNKYFYENLEGHVRLTEMFEEEYNRMIEEGKSKEYAYAYAQMTVEENYIESYWRQYARIYERERAKGLDRERAWQRGHKVVEFYFENILDGDCPDEIVDKYAQLCADYVEKGETKDRAEELAYKELFQE